MTSVLLLNDNSRGSHLVDRPLAVADFQLDAAAAGGEQRGAKAKAAGVEGGGFDAVVRGQAQQMALVHAAALEEYFQAGCFAAGVVEEAAVTVDGAVRSLLHDMVNALPVQLRRELGPARTLDAVVGPEDLRQPFQIDDLA